MAKAKKKESPICDKDCLNCKFPDCICDDMDAEDYAESRRLDCEFVFPKTKRQESIAAKKKAYREENRESIAAKKKAYYEENREKWNAYMREYRRKKRLIKAENGGAVL